MGGILLPLPSAVAATAVGRPYDWRDVRRDVFAPFEAAGYFSNVWATWLRDLVVDFGWFGAVLFCGLYGGFMAWARNRFELTGALHYHFLEVIACFVFAFGAFTGILYASWVAYAFFAALVMMVAVRVTFRSPIAAGASAPKLAPRS